MAEHSTRESRVWVTYKGGVYDVTGAPLAVSFRTLINSANKRMSTKLSFLMTCQGRCPRLSWPAIADLLCRLP